MNEYQKISHNLCRDVLCERFVTQSALQDTIMTLEEQIFKYTTPAIEHLQKED